MQNLLALFRIFPLFFRLDPFIETHDDFEFRGLPRNKIGVFLEMYEELNPESSLSCFRIFLLKVFSEKCVLVAIRDGVIVGFDYFYFNRQDLLDGSIHEGFVGVSERVRGQGISNKFRYISRKHFAKNRLAISTRIASDNLPSMRSALNNGYSVVRTYIDTNGVERNYLICRLESVDE